MVEVGKNKKLVLWFKETTIKDVPLVGGKNASLGEMYSTLSKKGVPIPNGFSITATAYRYLLEKSGIKKEIREILKDLDTTNMKSLAEKGQAIRNLIINATFPKDLETQIYKYYHKLSEMEGVKELDVAVRSSATAEDLPDASFAGQQETYLHIRGEKALLLACKKCFASLFTNRAISYRVDKKFDHFKIALSIGVQRMVRSDIGASGVMFSLDTETGFNGVVVINAAYGLGENVVQGAVTPDEFYVFKETLNKGFRAIISKKIGEKAIKMIYVKDAKNPTKNVSVPEDQRQKFCINDEQILQLAKWAIIIEDHYSKEAGHYKPMDMEWALDGATKKLFIVQARPETVQSRVNRNEYVTYSLAEQKVPFVVGTSIGQMIASGKANVIKAVKNIGQFKKGEILVTQMTDPDWEPIMKIASGIVTNKGGRTCFSGDTKILTNKGFLSFKDIFEQKLTDLKTPSLNRSTFKIEWKNITDVMKKKSKLIKINCSQTGKIEDNYLNITPDHKMINLRNSKLVDTPVQEMINQKEAALIAQNIPSLGKSKKSTYIAYLLGGLMTDGHISLTRTHGEVCFVQKPTTEKKVFIEYMNKCMQNVFGKSFSESIKKESSGFIRGKKVIGSANAYRCYSKEIATKLLDERDKLITTILSADTDFCYNFLAGVIDGDGTYNKGRVNIYISKEDLLQAVIISCLKLNIVPQVTKNRTINNLQIVEKLNEIGKFTKRIKCKDKRMVGTRFFNTKQLFSNDLNSDINNRAKKNLLVDDVSLERLLSQIKDKALYSNIKKLLNSDFRQTRINSTSTTNISDVYNITVEKNHNYIVFTSKYTPLIVNNCHAAIIARELGIPCIVGTGNGSDKIKQGEVVTIDCSSGDQGFVYKGSLKFDRHSVAVNKLPRTKTKIMMNVGNPEQAFELSFLPNDGVGLAREEFIINSWIQIHPLALINYNKITDKVVKSKIDKLTIGYSNKTQFFIDKLAYGIARIGSAFYPKKVILRLSDFKTDEYANLIGGKIYEPIESNPMIGWRGASRYYQGNYREGFALECLAIKKAREEFGLTNILVMVPFCRTIKEAKLVIDELKKNGLKQGEKDLKIIGMCEIPSNVILADQFLDIFDGFSIGSNDLTQLTLGLDRNSELLTSIYDERNEAVKTLISQVIKIAKKKKKYIGLCGQAPSDYPDFAEFLVNEGIESMSLNPDSVVKTTLLIDKTEKKLKK